MKVHSQIVVLLFILCSCNNDVVFFSQPACTERMQTDILGIEGKYINKKSLENSVVENIISVTKLKFASYRINFIKNNYVDGRLVATSQESRIAASCKFTVSQNKENLYFEFAGPEVGTGPHKTYVTKAIYWSDENKDVLNISSIFFAKSGELEGQLRDLGIEYEMLSDDKARVLIFNEDWNLSQLLKVGILSSGSAFGGVPFKRYSLK